MKEITRISLASLPYNIEIEAKKILEKYLGSIEQSLDADSDTMREIEARIAELLTERGVSGEKVVSKADIEAIKSQLGEPGDFVDSEAVESEVIKAAHSSKKLMRDGENRMLGGVCSGIANYFGWDATWVRLGAVVLTLLSSGFGAVVYMVLWVAMPKAKTAADRLISSGEPVTLASLKEISGQATNKSEPALVVVLRWLLGLGMLAGAIASVVAVVAAVIALVTLGKPYLNGWDSQLVIPATISMSIAGMSLAALLGLGAYVCFTKHLSRGIGIAAAGLLVLGIISSSVGIGAYMYSGDKYRQTVQQNEVKKVINLDLVDVSSLKIDPGNVTVNYHVIAGKTAYAELNYNKLNINHQPKITSQRDGNAASLIIEKSDNCQRPGCGHMAMLDIYGPALKSIELIGGSLSYQADSQDMLSLVQAKDTEIVVGSNGVIKNMDVKQADNASLEASGANIDTLRLQAENNGRFRGASLRNLGIDAPTTCAHNKSTDVTIQSADTITINGAAWNGDDVKCLTIERGEEVDF